MSYYPKASQAKFQYHNSPFGRQNQRNQMNVSPYYGNEGRNRRGIANHHQYSEDEKKKRRENILSWNAERNLVGSNNTKFRNRNTVQRAIPTPQINSFKGYLFSYN